MRRLFIFISFSLFLQLLPAQDFHYAFDMGSTGSDFARDVSTNRWSWFTNGASYVTGTHTGTVDFDPSAGVQTRTSAGMQDIYIAKYDSAGNLSWATDFGGTLNDAPNSISVFYNHVYVTGLFRGTVDFDPGIGSATQTASGDADIFLVHFDWLGNFQWVVTMGGSTTGNDEAGVSVFGADSGPYVTGVFEGSNVDFNPNGTPYYLNATGDQNIFIAKYNLSGELEWAKSMGSTTLDDEGGKGIVFDGSNVYVSGSFAGSCDFNPNGFGGTLTSSGGQDGFIASYTSTGAYRWARRIGGPLLDEVNDIAVDERGNVSVTGTVFGNVTYNGGSFTTNAGSQDAFVASLSDLGTFQWAHPLGGPGVNDEGRTLAMDKCGQIYVGGNFCNTADFNPGPGTANLTGPPCGFAPTNNTYFLACYDVNGNYKWAEGGNAASGKSEVWGIDLDLCNSMVAVGGYNQTQDFDITAGTQNLSPAGGYDAFVSKHFLPQIIVDSAHGIVLERAITCANNHKGRDSIVFCMRGNGPHTINQWNALSYITDDYTIIDGKTQPGWTQGNIIVDGTTLSTTSYGFRFDGCDYSEILGISVRDFPNHGIYAYNADHVNIQDCHVGGNGQDGIRFYNSAYGTIQGTMAGLSTTGLALDPNGRDGIATNGTADHLQLGGTTLAEANYIAGNTRYGVYLRSNNNEVEGNYIGTNSILNQGNGSHGVYIGGDLNRIGGTNPNEMNHIAYNGGYGIGIQSSAAYTQNHFWRNSYYCNTQNALEINIANQGITPPVINFAAINGIFGTGVPGGYVEIYAPDTSGCAGNSCQGRYYLGSANIDGTGSWFVSGSFNQGQEAVAIQTDGNQNTSNFSNCELIMGPLEINEILLSGEYKNQQVNLSWEYPQLQAKTSFNIEKSLDGTDWEIINQITAESGATQSVIADPSLVQDYTYYRIGQRLENGEINYSNTIQINPQLESSIRIYPNPASQFFQIRFPQPIDHLSIISITGKMVLEKSHLSLGEKVNIKNLSEGVYMMRLRIGQNIFRESLLITR